MGIIKIGAKILGRHNNAIWKELRCLIKKGKKIFEGNNQKKMKRK